jgi:hypothetical protein
VAATGINAGCQEKLPSQVSQIRYVAIENWLRD